MYPLSRAAFTSLRDSPAGVRIVSRASLFFTGGGGVRAIDGMAGVLGEGEGGVVDHDHEARGAAPEVEGVVAEGG